MSKLKIQQYQAMQDGALKWLTVVQLGCIGTCHSTATKPTKRTLRRLVKFVRQGVFGATFK